MFHLYPIRSLATICILVSIRPALGGDPPTGDLLGHESFQNMPAVRIVVDFDLDEISQGSFLKSQSQVSDRISKILHDQQGLPLTTDAGAPAVKCYLKIRALPVGQFNTPVFMYRLETAVLEEVTLNRPTTPPPAPGTSPPPYKRIAQIWRKADFGIVIPATLVQTIEVKVDRQAEALAKDWKGP